MNHAYIPISIYFKRVRTLAINGLTQISKSREQIWLDDFRFLSKYIDGIVNFHWCTLSQFTTLSWSIKMDRIDWDKFTKLIRMIFILKLIVNIRTKLFKAKLIYNWSILSWKIWKTFFRMPTECHRVKLHHT